MISYIVIHHSGFPNARNSDQYRAIDRYHRMLGWGGCGYHYVIVPGGAIYLGRPESEIGAHAYGVNRVSLGVCVTGNFEYEQPTAKQLSSLKRLLQDLIKRYPEAKVVPHCDTGATLCPGKSLKAILKDGSLYNNDNT